MINFKSPKTAVILALTGSSLLGLSLVSTKVLPLINRPEPILANQETKNSSQTNFIKVDVSGEVLKPAVYELPEGSRVEDAISASGGLTAQADRGWINKNLNLAQKITDGAKLYLPTEGATQKPGSLVLGVIDNEGKININTADASELDTLSGVGPVTAQKIIDNRPYSNIEELKTRKVVSNSVFEKIKDKITTY